MKRTFHCDLELIDTSSDRCALIISVSEEGAVLRLETPSLDAQSVVRTLSRFFVLAEPEYVHVHDVRQRDVCVPMAFARIQYNGMIRFGSGVHYDGERARLNALLNAFSGVLGLTERAEPANPRPDDGVVWAYKLVRINQIWTQKTAEE